MMEETNVPEIEDDRTKTAHDIASSMLPIIQKTDVLFNNKIMKKWEELKDIGINRYECDFSCRLYELHHDKNPEQYTNEQYKENNEKCGELISQYSEEYSKLYEEMLQFMKIGNTNGKE